MACPSPARIAREVRQRGQRLLEARDRSRYARRAAALVPAWWQIAGWPCPRPRHETRDGRGAPRAPRALGVRRLDGRRRSGREAPAGGRGAAAVGDLVGQGVRERVLELGEQARLVEELGGLELPSRAARLLRLVGDRLEERERHVLADDRRAWSSRLCSGASRSMRAARMARTVAGISRAPPAARQAIGAALACQHPVSTSAGRTPRGRAGCPRCAR